MGRTNTTRQTSFKRPGNVTFAFSTTNNSLQATTITLPPGSPWTSGLHWHETHTEYLQVIQGVARVTLNRVTENYTSVDGIIVVPRFARHEWQRSDAVRSDSSRPEGSESRSDIDLVVREWTDPVDGQKEIFFRNLNSAILDATARGPPNELWLTLQLFMIFAVLDNYPVLYSGPGALRVLAPSIEWLVTHVTLYLATLLGNTFALRGVYDEYTPRNLRQQLDTSKERAT